MKSSEKSHYVFSYFPHSLCQLTLSMFAQSSVKYILTQGDSILITSLASLQTQGAYGLASNYGGLIARMLFQPIEESSRSFFAKVCSPAFSTKEPSKEGIRQANSLLQNILKLYNLLSLVAFAVGPTLAPLLLKIIAGSRLSGSGAGDVLATYAYYIPFLAFNGVTEAFVAAVATTDELHLQSKYMTVFFALFIGFAFAFLQVLKLGAQGIVYANCVNMLLRILWNMNFIQGYFRRYSEVRYSSRSFG